RALVDARDDALPCGTVALARRLLPLQPDRAAVRAQQASQDADERGLPSSVAADERVALARQHGEGDIVEDPRPDEGLADRLRLRHGRPELIRPPVLCLGGTHCYFFLKLPQRAGSLTFALLTTGATIASSRLPRSVTILLPWSV